MNLKRIQILLEPRQHKALKKAAKKKKISVSQLIRELTDTYLSQVTTEEDEFLQTLENLRRIREKQPIYTGDPLSEVRAERERQLGEEE